MLVLSRAKNESIIIDGQVEVVIVEIVGDKVRLGIIAPKDIAVDRMEIHLQKQRGKRDEGKS